MAKRKLLPRVITFLKTPILESSSRPRPSWRQWEQIGLRLLVIFGWGLLLGRSFGLQVVHGRDYQERALANKLKTRLLRAERGVILDRQGEILARNAPGFRVAIDFSQLTDFDSGLTALAEKIAPLVDLTPARVLEVVYKNRSEGHDQATLLQTVDKERALAIETAAAGLSGVLVEADPQRFYPDGEALAAVVGYVGAISAEELSQEDDGAYAAGDKVGKMGVEASYDRELHGQHGQELLETDSAGSFFRRLTRQEPIPGQQLTLSLSRRLQLIAYEELAQAIEEGTADGGAVVAQDPRTGEILALVSFPAFDPNLFARGITTTDYQALLTDSRQPLFNRALSGLYPPGSTFKMVTAAAGLEEEVVNAQTTIDDRGFIQVGSFVFRDWQPGGHGVIDIIRAIAESSDTFFYIVGGGHADYFEGLGVDKLAEWARIFGLGSRLGIDIPGEAAGLVPSQAWKEEERGEPWYVGNTYHLAIGQGDLLLTPLQLSSITSTIANGGNLYRPFLVGKVSSAAGETLKEAPPQLVRDNLLSLDNLKLIRQGLKEACDAGGTGYPLYDFGPFEVGCKTGTSEFGIPDQQGNYPTHAWFTLFTPHPDYDQKEAELVLTVLLEGGGEGSRDAAPVARRILDRWLGE